MLETPLARRLAAAGAAVGADAGPEAGPLAAFRLARRRFKQCRRIEMQELAADIGVNRATLFRWVGSRDDLITEIIWSLTEPTFTRAVATVSRSRARRSGAQRVAATMGTFASAANDDAPYFRAFLRREPERALRLLTTRASSFQRRMVESVEKLIGSEIEAGRLDPPLPADDLAYLIVRIAETFIYSNLITGDPPDAAKVEQATAVLLGGGA